MHAAVSWLRRFFDGFASSVQIVEHENAHPTMIAAIDAGRDTTTVIYGHYDVQPVSVEQSSPVPSGRANRSR